MYLGKISEESMKIKDITTDTSIAIIEGEIFQLETRDIIIGNGNF